MYLNKKSIPEPIASLIDEYIGSFDARRTREELMRIQQMNNLTDYEVTEAKNVLRRMLEISDRSISANQSSIDDEKDSSTFRKIDLLKISEISELYLELNNRIEKYNNMRSKLYCDGMELAQDQEKHNEILTEIYSNKIELLTDIYSIRNRFTEMREFLENKIKASGIEKSKISIYGKWCAKIKSMFASRNNKSIEREQFFKIIKEQFQYYVIRSVRKLG